MKLSERQEATLAAAITVLSGLVVAGALVGVLWLIGAFFSDFSNVFLPLAVAGIIALILNPYHNWLMDRLKLAPVLALVAVFVTLLIPVAGFGWFVVDLLIDQVSDLVDKFPEWWASLIENARERWPKVQQLIERYGLDEAFRDVSEGQQSALLAGLRSISETALEAGVDFFGFIAGLLGWAVLPVYVAFFLLIDLRNQTRAWSHAALPFLKPETRDNVTYLVEEFVEIIVAFFRGQLLIAFLQGILFAIGFSIVGLQYGFLIGLVLGLLNIIPYLGSIVGLAVALPLALFQGGGGWLLVLWVLVVFTVVQMIEGYFLTPRIMGEQTGLHPMVIIVAIFFWGTALDGITGMILAIPLTAFFVVFWRLVQEKYIRELV